MPAGFHNVTNYFEHTVREVAATEARGRNTDDVPSERVLASLLALDLPRAQDLVLLGWPRAALIAGQVGGLQEAVQGPYLREEVLEVGVDRTRLLGRHKRRRWRHCRLLGAWRSTRS